MTVVGLEEYVGKPSKKEMPQNAFATTEFGFDIWMPFAKQWRQSLTSGKMTEGSNKWTVAPKSHGAESANAVAKDWAPMFDLFRQNFDTAYKAYPKTAARVASTTMGEELADILYDAQKLPPKLNKESGVGKYMATTGETKDYLVMEYMGQPDPGAVDTAQVDGPHKLISTGDGKGFSKLSKHSMDFIAENDDEVRNLEYTLARLSAHLDKDQKKAGFLDNIQGIEVTTELGTKYFSDAYNELSEAEGTPQKRLETAARNAADKIQKAYNKAGDTLTNAYGKLKTGTKKETGPKTGRKGVETAEYIGEQVVDRFFEVTERMFRQSGGTSIKGAYLYQIPLKGGEVMIGTKKMSPLIGFIRLEPVFKKNKWKKGDSAPNYGDLILERIATQALVVDMGNVAGKTPEEIASLLTGLHGTTANPNVIGLLSNFLIWDSHFHLGRDLGESLLLSEDMDAQVANTTVFTSLRRELYGSSLWVYTQGGINTLSPQAFVQAVKTLTAPEIAASLKDQFESFLNPKKGKTGKIMAKRYARFYEAAIKKSQSITRLWLTNISKKWGNWSGVKNSIFGKEHGYLGAKSGEGEGAAAAWFMNYNRDPGGWEEFKDKTGQGQVQYILKLLGGEVSTAGQMPGYKEAVAVQSQGTPMIMEGGQMREATSAEYNTSRGDQGARWAAESTLGPGGTVNQGTDIFLHGGTKMGGGLNRPESRGMNPFLVSKGQATSPFWGLSSVGKKVK